MSSDAAGPPALHPTSTPELSEQSLWHRLMRHRVGIIPLPVYALMLALLAAFAIRGKISGEVTVMIALIVFGTLINALTGLPAPVAMLFLVVLAKALRAVPASLEEGTRVVFRFFVIAVTYPLLFSTAVALTPWHELVEAFHPANLVTIIATVLSLTATGYYVGRLLRMFPIDTAIVNACHSGLGGTGDVMILTAAERMELMPFAQVATRIGGALTVTAAIIAMAHFQAL